MGVERQVKIAPESPAHWPAIRSLLVRAGETPALRIIDGELSFPGDEPPADWNELRIALSGGMITLRRTPTGMTCVSWGSADPALAQSWNLLAWAVASSAGGSIDGESAADFAKRYKLTAG